MELNLVLLTGIGYSAVGALVMYLSHRSLYRKAARIVAGYPRDEAALDVQRHDNRYGLVILMCGNLLQVLAACGYTIAPHFWRYPIATFVGVLVLYALWRLLARQTGSREVAVDRPYAAAPRAAAVAHRVFETRRSAILLDAAIREAAKRKAREQALQPRNLNVVYVRHPWECRWWSDRFGVTQDALRTAVSRVGPMVADVERYLGLTVRTSHARAA